MKRHRTCMACADAARIFYRTMLICYGLTIIIGPCTAQPAPGIHVWTELVGTRHPKMNSLGDRLATISQNGNSAAVYDLSKGVPGKVLWKSDDVFPSSRILDCEWIGNTLLLSKVDSSVSLKDESHWSDEQLNAFLSSKSNVVALDAKTFAVSVLQDQGYEILRASNTGTHIAAVSPWDGGKSGTVDFFTYTRDNKLGKR